MSELVIGSSIHAARQTGTTRKPGKVAGTTTKAGEIEIDGIGYPLNAGGNRSPLHVDWMTRAIRHIDAKIAEFGRALIVRIDLHHPEYEATNARATAFIEAMSKAIKREYGHKLGYVWAREQETAKAHHYHMALILDGDRVQQGIAVNKLAAKVWGKMGGTLGRCDDYWQMVGRGGVTLPEVSFWLSYLTKIRGKGSKYRADYAQDFSTGRETTKARPKKRGQIVKVTRVEMPWGLKLGGYRRIGNGGLTVEQFHAVGMPAVIAGAWGKVGGLGAVSRHFGVAHSTVRRYVQEYRPGEAETVAELAERRQAATRAKGIELLRAGLPHKAIADKLGVNDQRPGYWIGTDEQLKAERAAKMAAQASKRAKVDAMIDAGAGTKEIAAAAGVDENTVVNRRKAKGAPIRQAKRYPPEVKAAALAMRAKGATIQAVADAHELPFQTVATWIRAAKL